MAARVVALAALNGSLEDEVIMPYLDSLCAAGYEGVCLAPFDGLMVPYNSRPYWEAIDHIIGLCRQRGLEVWHYDEFPFPSGALGGVIPELFPAARVRSLEFVEIDTTPNNVGLIDIGPGALLALLRYRVDENGRMCDVRDVTEYSGAHFDTWVWGEWHNLFYTGTAYVHKEEHERSGADRTTIVYRTEEPIGDDKLLAIKLITPRGKKGWAGLPDVMLPEVTDLFLEQIYARFAAISKQHNIAGALVFQDEVSFHSWSPWNREIEKRLRAVWGDNTFTNLAAIYKPNSEGWEHHRYQYRTACQDAIETNWFARVADYCHSHGLRMTGHLAGEESIIGHCSYLGDIFKNLRHFDLPGYDIISSTLPDDIDRGHAAGIKLVQSAAWLEGRQPTMAEVFSAHGGHMDLQKSRTVLAWLIAHDIATVADHSPFTSALGTRKYMAPPVNNRFNPLFAGQPDLWQWHNWFADLLQEYRFNPQVLCLFPIDALARFSFTEMKLWKEQTDLLETFFHTLCAHTLDCIFMPSDLLAEVEASKDGFTFRGHTFKHFIVPPVHSLHETTFAALQPLASHPNFCWVLPQDLGEIAIFGDEHPHGTYKPVNAKCVLKCDEAQLAEDRASYFDIAIGSRVAHIQTAATIQKSMRRGADGDLLVLINPHNKPIPVTSSLPLGEAVQQPPNDVAVEVAEGDSSFVLPPRATAIFRQDKAMSASVINSRPWPRLEVRPQRTRCRFSGVNHQSVKSGTAVLDGQGAVEFRPKPVSHLWRSLNVADNDKSGYIEVVGVYSLEKLPSPREFKVSFPLRLHSDLEDLLIAIDAESLPPGTGVLWDDSELAPQTADLYETGNTVFLVPPELLTAGKHTIHFHATVTNAAQGVLERPILVGRFLVADTEPLTLKPMSENWIELSEMQTWPQLGMPDGFGPVKYEHIFGLSPDEAKRNWTVVLPPCIGVAEVHINGESVGRSIWEPRELPINSKLQTGENVMNITLHGSWNNVFSQLNRLANGLTDEVVLRAM